MAAAGLGFEAASITELSLGHTAHIHAATATSTALATATATATIATATAATAAETATATSTIRLVFDSPAKTRAELYIALQQPGVLVNCNCFSELDRIAAIIAASTTTKSADTSIKAKVGIRINPLIGAGAVAEMSVAADAGSKFGVPLTAVNRARVIAAFSRYDWLVGLHVHVGSQVQCIYLNHLCSDAVTYVHNHIQFLRSVP
jgi:diaminopimelate decarboxylase